VPVDRFFVVRGRAGLFRGGAGLFRGRADLVLFRGQADRGQSVAEAAGVVAVVQVVASALTTTAEASPPGWPTAGAVSI
jgi:hypothetical protein